MKRLHRKEYDISLMKFAIIAKLEQAKRLLEEGDEVSEVSDKPGFSGVHYFSRRFKRHYHISPSKL